ncbi:wax ester/triacylglycerol synthase family O-acyltransferase [Mycolicibacterium chubuense]|uniref:Diacylglycerol O-acyltransferase n=1 Tax=Mycolicibacterium chubuense TaxID=1800 RepID=A0A0J6WM70_MYCCU|nr:wax ester/triacylglycerol synthase family O-acyltransferase [Mycolicibacterium chubuense]KMO84470.1 putative diacylglycerol O-acyltransferase [Mycolicibacterium chubuense]ORA53840.1 wax ester/triacylglycerol synthase family O-acyltransferase [Mycolicibacterium chubuense]SPX95291.1 Diacylglycerol O-acyltransferase [Mycolicibacterium chubuense]
MHLMSPLDSTFLHAESREHPLHVAGLQLFTPPADAGPEFVRETYEAMRGSEELTPTFRQRPAVALGGITNLAWAFDDAVDLDYHVRRSALPAPGRVRELLELTSRLHGTLLDRHRPLWEMHVIEGLDDGRFAIYTKMHHGVVDGVSALNLLQGSLSLDAADADVQAPWSMPSRATAHAEADGSRLQKLSGAVQSTVRHALSAGVLARAALWEQQMTLPFRAPRTMLNVPIGGARRCAAQSWSLDRIKAVKNAAGVTVNDVVLAMCAGALKSYLIENDALPDAPLVAMVPVNLRTARDTDGGNVASAVLCTLATDLEDPAQRLATIAASMRDNKTVLSQLPRSQAIAMGLTTTLAPALLSLIPGIGAATPPSFNLCISNVPGVQHPLYRNGARLDGNYPLSMVVDGQALNITLATSADSLDFGLVGCRRAVPHLQRLLGHLETSLKDLECAVGL